MSACAQHVATRISRPKAWLMALRVPTLPAAVVPVLVGSALAARAHAFSAVVFAAVLAASLLIQIGTNLTNDLADFRKGADTSARLGPTRVTQAGLLSPAAVAAGSALSFGLAALLGVYLITVGGWPILIAGLASIAAGIAYTAGPWPYGYHGLGDLFVFVFFGLVAVLGTFYLQTGSLTPLAFALSIPVAALVTAILVVNNFRDLETDRHTGKHTLAVIIGARATRAEYIILLALAYLVILGVWAHDPASFWILLPFLTAPMAARLIGDFRSRQGMALNPTLRKTAALHLLFGLLLAVGLVL